MPITKPTTTCNSHSSGFTFLELIATVLILGIVAASATPLLASSLTQARLDAAATAVASGLEYAQFRAMSSSSEHRVSFDTGADRVQLESLQFQHAGQITDTSRSSLEGSKVAIVQFQDVPDPLNPNADYDFNFNDDTRYNGVNMTAANFGGSDAVDFNLVGTPNSGGSVTLQLGGQQRVVTLSATGQVTIN